jgi:nucleotide-binding universal stress UspA family protein
MRMVPKRIAVAIDFGEMSLPALEYGRDLAHAFGAELSVLHVAPNIVAANSAEGFTPNFEVMQGEIEEGARKQLDSLLNAGNGALVHATPVLRRSNAPADAIVDYAREAGIDLLIAGAHTSTVMPHTLMGSIAERVVRSAACPVLVVRPISVTEAARHHDVAVTA